MIAKTILVATVAALVAFPSFAKCKNADKIQSYVGATESVMFEAELTKTTKVVVYRAGDGAYTAIEQNTKTCKINLYSLNSDQLWDRYQIEDETAFEEGGF